MAKQKKRHVETYVESMQRYIHMHKNSTCSNIEDVAKMGCCTW